MGNLGNGPAAGVDLDRQPAGRHRGKHGLELGGAAWKLERISAGSGEIRFDIGSILENESTSKR